MVAQKRTASNKSKRGKGEGNEEEIIIRKKMVNFRHKRRKIKECCNLRIGTLNILTLNGKLEEIIDMMMERKLDILGLSETKWKGTGTKELRDGFKLWWSGGNEGKNGVGFIVNAKIKNDVVTIENIDERLIKMAVMVKKRRFEIIQGYAPQVGRPTKEKEAWVSKLENEIKSNNVIVMGDLNAKVGANRIGFEHCLGENGYGKRDLEGTQLLEMCSRNGLIIGNSLFKKRKEHHITRYSWDGVYESVIDYILVSRELRNILLDVRVIPSVALDGDHRLLIGVVRIEQETNAHTKKSNPIIRKRLKVWRLKDDKIKKEFKKRVEDALTEGELRGVEEEWNNMKHVLLNATEELCGRAGGKRRSKQTAWWNDNVKKAVKR